MLHRNIFLLLGSNSGDRLKLLRLMAEAIQHDVGRIIAISKVYETAPWGKVDQPDFLNQVVRLETPLSPPDLLRKVQSIEVALGRTRGEKWGERSVDIDILYYGRESMAIPGLVIPHPHIADRRFVLVPLAEISPEFVHPVLQKSTLELLNECRDTLAVNAFKG